jgi:hypothetical protein
MVALATAVLRAQAQPAWANSPLKKGSDPLAGLVFRVKFEARERVRPLFQRAAKGPHKNRLCECRTTDLQTVPLVWDGLQIRPTGISTSLVLRRT